MEVQLSRFERVQRDIVNAEVLRLSPNEAGIALLADYLPIAMMACFEETERL